MGYPQQVITLIRLFGVARKLKSLFPGQGKGNSGHLVFPIVNSGNRVLTLQIDQVEHPEHFSCVESCKIHKTLGITTFWCKSDVIIWPKIVDYRQSKTLTGLKFAPEHSGGYPQEVITLIRLFGVARKLKSLFPGQGKGKSGHLVFLIVNSGNRALMVQIDQVSILNTFPVWSHAKFAKPWELQLFGAKVTSLFDQKSLIAAKVKQWRSSNLHRHTRGGVSARSNHANSAFRGGSKIKLFNPRAGKREERPICFSNSQLWKTRFDGANRPMWASGTTFLCGVMQNSQNLGNYNFWVQTWRHNLTKNLRLPSK